MQKYSSFEYLARRFSKDAQVVLLNHVETAYLSDTPTIGLVSETFGFDNAALWIQTQIMTIDFYNGTTTDGDYNSIKEMSMLFARMYGHIKLTEFLLFIARFKLGIYGKFYGSFDPIALGESFKLFLRGKAKEMTDIEHDKAAAYGSDWFKPPKGYSSLTWYQELKRRASEGDEEAIKLITPP